MERPSIPANLGPIVAAEIGIANYHTYQHITDGLSDFCLGWDWDELLDYAETVTCAVDQKAVCYIKIAHAYPPPITCWWWQDEAMKWNQQLSWSVAEFHQRPLGSDRR